MPYGPGTQFTVTSGFGSRSSGTHPGIDFAAQNGTPIPAAGDGTVWYVGRYIEVSTVAKVLMKARIMTPLLSGDLQVAGELSDEEALALARRIASEELTVEVRVTASR